MALVLKDRVRENTTTTGTGDITLAGAVSASYRRFGAVMSIGDTCWYAIVLPGGAWETGVGTYTSLNNMQRTAVLDSSTSALVSFAAGTKDVFICLPASKGNIQNNTFPSGTLMLFQQTNAPIYWTKQVTHNDKALRVVSGTASSGGANSFSSVLNTTISTANTTLVVSTMPNHAHPGSNVNSNNSSSNVAAGGSPIPSASAGTIASQGGDNAHSHPISLQIQYVDLIICSKDT